MLAVRINQEIDQRLIMDVAAWLAREGRLVLSVVVFLARVLLFCADHVQCAIDSGGKMHLKDEQIGRLAEKVLGDLERTGLVTPKRERGAILLAIRSAIGTDLKVEEALERDAEALLEQTLRSVGSEGIDRHKMLRMIKDRLAKERKIVL
jgi:hypothetical protein